MRWTKFRHKIVTAVLTPFFRLFFRIKYNCRNTIIEIPKRPYLILANHQATMDPFFVGILFRFPIYYMASSDIFASRKGKIMSYLIGPIPKNKSSTDLMAVKHSMQVIKEGGSVCIFPEGNRTYTGELVYIPKAIVKMVRALKAPLVLVSITGGYGSDPRWGKKVRKGKLETILSRVVEFEEYSKMSDDELYQLIRDKIDPHALDNPVAFKSNIKAERLERALYKCPICNHIGHLHSEGNFFRCSKCKLEVEYTEHLTFKTSNPSFKFKYVKDWYDYQVDYIKNYDVSTDGVIFSDSKVNLLKMRYPKKGEVLIKDGTLKMFNDRFEFNDKVYKFDEISAVTVLGKNKINFYIGVDIYQIKSIETFCAVKYLHMYYHISNKKNNIPDDYLGL